MLTLAAVQPSSPFNTIAPVPPGCTSNGTPRLPRPSVAKGSMLTTPVPISMAGSTAAVVSIWTWTWLDATPNGGSPPIPTTGRCRVTDRHRVAVRTPCRPAPPPGDHPPDRNGHGRPVVSGQPDDLAAPGQSIVGFGAPVHPLECDPVVAHATRGTGSESDRQDRGLAGSDTKARHDRAIGCEHRGSDGFRRVEPGRSRVGQPDRLQREPKRGRRGTGLVEGAAPYSTWTGTATTGRSIASSTVPPSIGDGVRPHACLGSHRSEVKVERRPARRRAKRRVSEIAIDRQPQLAFGRGRWRFDDEQHELAAGPPAVGARHRPLQPPWCVS